ncbi:MAG: START domain-containing protein [Saprospiraceae bacterium]
MTTTKTIKKYSLILFALVLFSSFSPPSKWQKKHDKDGLVVYTRTNGNLKEFKTEITLPYSVDAIIALLQDYENHPNWMTNINKCQLVKQINNKSRHLYYEMYLPWPLSNRDIVSKSSFIKNKDNSVRMNIKATKGIYKKTKHVRITEASGYWTFTPITANKTKMTYQYMANPVGIPSRVVGWFLVDGPVKTITGMRKQLPKSKYKNARVDWLH